MLFDPFELDTSVTPGRIRAALRQRDFTRAILMAFRLNERKLLQEALESVPWDEIEVVSSSLPDLYVEKVLEFLASSFEVSRHLEFYLIWTQKLLMVHGQKLKSRYTLPAHRGVWSLGLLVGAGWQLLPGDSMEQGPWAVAHTEDLLFPEWGRCCRRSSSFRRASSATWTMFPNCM